MSAAAVLARASRGLAVRGVAHGSIRTQDVAGRRIPALSALARYYASKSFPPHTIISMPALSPTMTAGNIGTWQKKPGDSLAPGEVLVEIETDKAQMDFEFQDEGVLAKILKDSGEKDVAVGNPIAVMIEEGGDVSAFEEFTVDDAGGEKTPPAEKKEGGQEAAEASEPPKTGSNTAPPEKPKEDAPKPQESESTGGRLSPSLDRFVKIRQLADEKGLSLPYGNVTEKDIANSKPSSGAAPAASGAAAAPAYTDIELSSMRKTIASRLTQSWNENPHYFVRSKISVSKLLKLRAALNASADGEFKLSVNDLLIKAVAVAARKVPAANSSWREDKGKVFIRQHDTVDVSVAVATPVGLMTPIVKNVNGLGLRSISSQVKDLGKRARDGKLKPEEYQGGTITISNMGMNPAVSGFTAIINPPQATILAIGTTKKEPVVRDGEDGNDVVEIDEQVEITASFDHKVVDGAVGADFMRELKKVIESPLELQL